MRTSPPLQINVIMSVCRFLLVCPRGPFFFSLLNCLFTTFTSSLTIKEKFPLKFMLRSGKLGIWTFRSVEAPTSTSKRLFPNKQESKPSYLVILCNSAHHVLVILIWCDWKELRTEIRVFTGKSYIPSYMECSINPGVAMKLCYSGTSFSGP